jgi:preprotein translocase subunit SecF
MDKRHLHHVWTKVRFIKPWYLLLIALISLCICVSALRNNNQHMSVLRTAVYSADMNNGDVKDALLALQAYVTAHMNTNLTTPDGVYPPIQLKYTYDRLVQAESDRVNTANTQVYTDAQVYCQQQDPTDFSGRNRVPCVTAYVTSHGTTATPIPDSLYQFDFISPTWSPDLAGWSAAATALSTVVFVVLFIFDRILKRSTK